MTNSKLLNTKQIFKRQALVGSRLFDVVWKSNAISRFLPIVLFVLIALLLTVRHCRAATCSATGDIAVTLSIESIDESPDDDPKTIEELLAMDDIKQEVFIVFNREKAAKLLESGLTNQDSSIRVQAIELLPDCVPANQLIKQLEPLLADENAVVRKHAAVQLHELGHHCPQLVDVLIRSIHLCEFGEVSDALDDYGRSLLDPLLEMLTDPNEDLEFRRKIFEHIRGKWLIFSYDYQDELLSNAMKSSDQLIRRYAVMAHTMLNQKDHSVLPTLLEIIKDESAEIETRKHAFDALKILDFPENKLDEKLEQLMFHYMQINDEDFEDLSYAAVKMLRKNELSEDSIEKVLDAYTDLGTRPKAFEIIVNGVTRSQKFVPILLERFDTADGTIRWEIEECLNRHFDLAQTKCIAIFADQNEALEKRLKNGPSDH